MCNLNICIQKYNTVTTLLKKTLKTKNTGLLKIQPPKLFFLFTIFLTVNLKKKKDKQR